MLKKNPCVSHGFDFANGKSRNYTLHIAHCSLHIVLKQIIRVDIKFEVIFGLDFNFIDNGSDELLDFGQ